MSLRFSVVVPVYNNPDDLARCISSLKAQSFPSDRYEIIIVDNNSTDHTPAVAREMGVQCLREVQFQSSYAARNAGIMAAKGELIAFTDSDCVAHADWLEAIHRASSDEAAGCLAGEILSVPPSTTVERFSESIGLLRQKGPLSGWHFKPYAQTANAVYRKTVFDRIGVFDPTTNSGGDATIAWRMQDKLGATLKFVPDAIVYHHHRTNVDDLYAQFRRYGGGKMSWALAQADYRPPDINGLEKEAVKAFSKLFELLETEKVPDEVKFSALKAVTQAAHLSGYIQDLLKFCIGETSLTNAPQVALQRAPTCCICGSRSFFPGPNGRLANRRPPRCRECGSLERHRVLKMVLRGLEEQGKSPPVGLVVGEAIPDSIMRFSRLHVADPSQLTAIPADLKAELVIGLHAAIWESEDNFSSFLDGVTPHLTETGGLLLLRAGPRSKGVLYEHLLRKLLPGVNVVVAEVIDAGTGAELTALAAAPTGSLIGEELVRGLVH